MKTKLIFLFFSLFSVVSFAQKTILTGQIKLQNSGNFKLKDVKVSNIWNTTLTDSEGKFNLVFINRKIGDMVDFKVEKYNYEIVNIEDLRVTLTGLEDYNYKIVLCRKGQLAENRLKYYNVAVDNILKNYKKKLMKLDKNNSNYISKIKELEKGKQLALKNARMFAEKYAKVNFDDVSESFKIAFDYFQIGKLDSALIVLDSTNLTNQKIKIIEFEEKLNQANQDYEKLSKIYDNVIGMRKIRGFVKNENNIVLNNVLIKIDKLQTYTNTNGEFSITIPTKIQNQVISFQKENYITQKVSIDKYNNNFIILKKRNNEKE